MVFSRYDHTLWNRRGFIIGASARKWWSVSYEYAELCRWVEAARNLTPEFLISRKRLLEAQQPVTEKGDDSCHANMLSGFDLNTTRRQRNAARLCCLCGGPSRAFVTVLQGDHDCMTLGTDMPVVPVWHRLGHRVVHAPANMPPPPCRCNAGVAFHADQVIVFEKVAKMTQMRHDNLADALYLVISACSCPLLPCFGRTASPHRGDTSPL